MHPWHQVFIVVSSSCTLHSGACYAVVVRIERMAGVERERDCAAILEGGREHARKPASSERAATSPPPAEQLSTHAGELCANGVGHHDMSALKIGRRSP